MPKLSVTVITRNEAGHIADALASVGWADELLVVDCGSTDDTVALARQAGARVAEVDWPGFPQQKNRAATLASHDWILSIDADERVTPDLAREIAALLREEPAARGYRLARVTHAFGRVIRATDWYPDWQLRLYDCRAGTWDETRRVHESVRLDGRIDRLQGELQHFAYRDLSHHLQTIDRYTTLAAEDLHAEGRRAGWVPVAVHPPLAFLRNYVLRGGYRLGSAGLVISAMNSWYVFLKYAKLWEKAGWGQVSQTAATRRRRS